MNYFFLIASIVVNVVGQSLIKGGTLEMGGIHINGFMDIIKVFLNPYIFAGIVVYGLGTIFWIIALSKFELSYAYPFLSLGYILVLIISYFIFKENINMFKVLGVSAIIIGLFLISQK